MDFWRWGKYFTPQELFSPSGLIQYERHQNCLMQEFFLDRLVAFREYIDIPLRVNGRSFSTGSILRFRGYRSPLENSEMGGTTYSRHMQGIAVDISTQIDKMLTQDLYQKAMEFGIFGGVFYYPNLHFVHIDGRPKVNDIIKQGVML